MKIICAVLLSVIFSLELLAQTYFSHTDKSDLNLSTKKEGLSNISLGLGFAEAIRYTTDEHNRNHDFRPLINLGMIAKVYHPLYLSMSIEYSRKDLDGHDNAYNFSFLPSLAGTVFNKKISYFTEIGPNVVAIHYPEDKMIQFTLGITFGLKAQYKITDKYSVGLSIRHINYFNIWSEHYFIVHSNVYFAMKI